MEGKKIRCLLLTPYSNEFPELRKFLAEALKEIGVEPILLEEMPISGISLIEKVQREIERADFILVDISGNNPNVMFEVGYALAMRKPLFFIVQRGERIPADLRGFLFFVYNPLQPEVLKREIKRWAFEFIRSSKKVKLE